MEIEVIIDIIGMGLCAVIGFIGGYLFKLAQDVSKEIDKVYGKRE